MAPRKRTTRQHKVDPKMAKLEAFLQDFDCEGKFNFVPVPGWMTNPRLVRALICYSCKNVSHV